MELQQYHDTDQRFRTALIAKEGRKWMQVVVVDAGSLKMIRRPLADKEYMSTIPANRKALASMRRLARKRGTSRNIRAAVAAL